METGTGMLYMVGKIFQYGINFIIVCNESGHKHMNKFDYFFPPCLGKNIITKTEMEDHERALCCHIYIYIYQLGPSHSDY